MINEELREEIKEELERMDESELRDLLKYMNEGRGFPL